MPVKIGLSGHVERFGNVEILKWVKQEKDLVAEDDILALVSEGSDEVIALQAGQNGLLAKIIIPAGTKGLKGKEVIGVMALADDEVSDVLGAIKASEHLNGIIGSMHVVSSTEDLDPGNRLDVQSDVRKSETLPNILYSSAVRSLLCLIGTVVTGWIGFAVARTLGTSSDPNGPAALLTIVVAICLIGASLYYLTKMPEEHGEATDSLLPAGVSCAAAFVAFLAAMFYRQNINDFYLFVTAAGCGLLYAGYRNIKLFDIRDGIITTLVELAFLPFVSIVAVAAIVVRNSENSKAGSAGNRRATMNVARLNDPVIGAVVEHARGTFTVYDEANQRIAQITFAGAELAGYSASSFQLRASGRLYLYNSRGQRTGDRTFK